MKELMTLSDYVMDLESDMGLTKDNRIDSMAWILTVEHTKFVKQQPNPSMFVPAILVDGKWQVLSEPDDIPKGTNEDSEAYMTVLPEHLQYQEALSKVVFDGFSIKYSEEGSTSITNGVVHVYWDNPISGWKLSHGIKTIEDLTKYKLKLK